MYMAVQYRDSVPMMGDGGCAKLLIQRLETRPVKSMVVGAGARGSGRGSDGGMTDDRNSKTQWPSDAVGFSWEPTWQPRTI